MPPLSLVFRRAHRADLDAIESLVQSAYRGEPSRQGWTTEADLLDGQRTDRDELLALIESAHSRLVLAYADLSPLAPPSARFDQLVGSVQLACVDASPRAREQRMEQAVYIGMLSVRPALQSQGVGRALLAEVERIACEERLGNKARMTVIGQRVELIAWYERQGYRRTGAHEAFPYGQPRFGLPRREDLYFEVLEKELAERHRLS